MNYFGFLHHITLNGMDLSLFSQIEDGFVAGLCIVTPTPLQLYFKNIILLFYFIL